ncbi:phosphotransferase enzyme family protein [Catellatospora sichuanensis]|uniref:phosphotransferase enzyme family protein n=1 Tax=Catellatospora sichuanensis TaxID=1969805 RepID=UPI00118216DD|nr:aminoglycoside phosphotransferase family protein [Catellatospora sichuanensis]
MTISLSAAAPVSPGATLESDAHTALQAIAAAAGIDADHAQLVKFYNNATFLLPNAGVVARVAGSPSLAANVHKVVRVATWLADNGYPAVRLKQGLQNPVAAPGALASLWDYVPPVRQGTAADLARLLRRLHAMRPPDHLPRWDPVEDVRKRVRDAVGLTDDDRRFLLDECDELEPAVLALSDDVPHGLIHGDANVDNVIVGAEGPILCDFDRIAVGPLVWDLIPVATGSYHFEGGTAAQLEFAQAYGSDVRDWPGFPMFHRLRELKVVSSVVSLLEANPHVRPEFEHRLRTFRAGETHARWHRFGAAPSTTSTTEEQELTA